MTKIICGFLLLAVCCGNTWGQASKYSFAATSGNATVLGCSTPIMDPIARCPDQSWVYADNQGVIFYDGSFGMQAQDAYGLLQASGEAVVNCHFTCAAGSASSGAGGQAVFNDEFTFVGLPGDGPYFLVVNLAVVGATSGGWLRGISSVIVNASADLTVAGAPLQQCIPAIVNDSANQGVYRRTCISRIQFSPTDTVKLAAIFSLGLSAVTPESTTNGVIQTVQSDFLSSKGYGARYTVHIEDAKGRKVNKGQIITASGVTYPTH